MKKGNLSIAPIPDKPIDETNCLSFPVSVTGGNGNSILSFSLGAGAPDGAQIDPSTGVFSWCPTECQGPGTYTIPIYVVDYGYNEANDLGFVNVTVNEVNEPPWLLPSEQAAYVGETNVITLCTGDPDCPPNPLTYKLLGQPPSGAAMDSKTGVLSWVPTAGQVGTYDLSVQLCDGGKPNLCVTNTLTVAVTTHAPYRLDAEELPSGDVQFTIVDGRTDVCYDLMRTTSLCECPCQSQWDPVRQVCPDATPFSFVVSAAELTSASTLYFRLEEVFP